MENTKKGPGRPPHNAHPTTCSGDPISEEELTKKRLEAEEKKRRKQSERQKRQDAKKCSSSTNSSSDLIVKTSTSDCNSSSSSSCLSISPNVNSNNKCSYSIDRILYQTLSSSTNQLKRKSLQSNNSLPNKFNKIDDGKVPQAEQN